MLTNLTVNTFQSFLRRSIMMFPTPITKTIMKMHRFMWARELSFINDDIAKGYSNFRREFGGFLYHKTCYYHTISNPSPMYLPKQIKNLCPHKNLHMYKSYITNCPNLEAIKMSFSSEKTVV